MIFTKFTSHTNSDPSEHFKITTQEIDPGANIRDKIAPPSSAVPRRISKPKLHSSMNATSGPNNRPRPGPDPVITKAGFSMADPEVKKAFTLGEKRIGKDPVSLVSRIRFVLIVAWVN